VGESVVVVVVAIAVVVTGSGEVGDVDVDSVGDGPGEWGEEATSDWSADIVPCAAACCACNKEGSSTADSSWFERRSSLSNS
jgi:hypothetical protein